MISNNLNMYKLRMKRTLIILLYITCISRELLSAAMIFVYAYYHRIDLALEYPLSRWLTSVFDFMDIGLIVTVILTNLQLATSMQSIRGFTTEETEVKRNTIARTGGLIFVITSATC